MRTSLKITSITVCDRKFLFISFRVFQIAEILPMSSSCFRKWSRHRVGFHKLGACYHVRQLRQHHLWERSSLSRRVVIYHHIGLEPLNPKPFQVRQFKVPGKIATWERGEDYGNCKQNSISLLSSQLEIHFVRLRTKHFWVVSRTETWKIDQPSPMLLNFMWRFFIFHFYFWSISYFPFCGF